MIFFLFFPHNPGMLWLIERACGVLWQRPENTREWALSGSRCLWLVGFVNFNGAWSRGSLSEFPTVTSGRE